MESISGGGGGNEGVVVVVVVVVGQKAGLRVLCQPQRMLCVR